MAATKGAMTSLQTSQSIFLPTIEEPEHNSINFRDSLKFFQEQLVINGTNFPSPSSTCRTGNDTLKKNVSHSFREQSPDNSDKSTKENDVFDGEIQTVKSCKISIPTVDTILESVRVLRAIQRSQEERGSAWNLDVTSKSDGDFADGWIQVSNEKQDAHSQTEPNNINDESTETNLLDNHSPQNQDFSEIYINNHEDIHTLDVNSSTQLHCSCPVNEVCAFWPSNTLINDNHLEKENVIHEFPLLNTMKDEKSEIDTHNVNGEKEKIEESGIFNKSKSTDEVHYENMHVEQNKRNLQPQEQKENDIRTNGTLEDKNESEILTHSNNTIHKQTKTCSTSDSLTDVCRDILNYVNERNSNIEMSAEEILQNEHNNSSMEILKIETYQDISVQKHDDFLLNESLWKENCSPNDSNSAKLENNDSDSGIGTQRSASSLSPNNPSQMQKDSWSDTCSSHYASAECSPYHSLNSVFDLCLGLNTTAFAKDTEEAENSTHISNNEWAEILEKPQETEAAPSEEQDRTLLHPEVDYKHESQADVSDEASIYALATFSITENEFQDAGDAEISRCSFISSYTIENPSSNTIEKELEKDHAVSEICDTTNEQSNVNGYKIERDELISTNASINESTQIKNLTEYVCQNDFGDGGRIQKFTAASCDLVTIVESLYAIKENPAYQMLPSTDEELENFEETLFVLSEGAFCDHPGDNYVIKIENSILQITKDSQVLLQLNMKYGEVTTETKDILKIDNRMGRYVYIRTETEAMVSLKNKIESHCLKHWRTDCLQLVHYPLKCHENVIIIDLGSCSTRAGILMDQPTLPSLFFPTVCATDRDTGTCVYGMEALQPEVRQHSNLSFPVRPSIKITKHTIDIDLLDGLFQRIFSDLKVDPTEYTVQVCLPRNLSINAQNALIKLLLETLKVKAVSLTNQAILTLYAHEVSTAVVVDIGDRTDVLPVVDGFIVESGVTKLPYGGQRLIHHMKHGLAEKRISLSNDIDSFLVQYIIENLAYVAEDYDNEIQTALNYPDVIKKTVTLQPASPDRASFKSITLEEARFKVPEGLFNPELWGLDSPGIHHLVQKAIQATSVDARKQIAENIYVSGGVTMLPGFVERLNKEVAKLSKAKIVPKVHASNYRYHCTYIGACKFAKMEVFPQVCINLAEYTKNRTSALKKCALYF